MDNTDCRVRLTILHVTPYMFRSNDGSIRGPSIRWASEGGSVSISILICPGLHDRILATRQIFFLVTTMRIEISTQLMRWRGVIHAGNRPWIIFFLYSEENYRTSNEVKILSCSWIVIYLFHFSQVRFFSAFSVKTKMRGLWETRNESSWVISRS